MCSHSVITFNWVSHKILETRTYGREGAMYGMGHGGGPGEGDGGDEQREMEE